MENSICIVIIQGIFTIIGSGLAAWIGVRCGMRGAVSEYHIMRQYEQCQKLLKATGTIEHNLSNIDKGLRMGTLVTFEKAARSISDFLELYSSYNAELIVNKQDCFGKLSSWSQEVYDKYSDAKEEDKSGIDFVQVNYNFLLGNDVKDLFIKTKNEGYKYLERLAKKRQYI